MRIIVDTREQLPYTFKDVRQRLPGPIEAAVETVQAGDYTVGVGALSAAHGSVAVERKTLADLYGTVSWGRERFEAELGKLAELDYAAIVIEAEWSQIVEPNAHLDRPTQMSPRSVINSLLCWSVRYGVHLFCCPNRRFAEQVTYRLLEAWYEKHAASTERDAICQTTK